MGAIGVCRLALGALYLTDVEDAVMAAKFLHACIAFEKMSGLEVSRDYVHFGALRNKCAGRAYQSQSWGPKGIMETLNCLDVS